MNNTNLNDRDRKKANLIKKLLRPLSRDEDLRRQELILNILLGLSICCFAILNLIRLKDVLAGVGDIGMPITYTLLILLFFIFLLWLSRKGRIKIAAWLLIIVYSLPMFYSFVAWGADLPAALLLAVLIIALCGVLIGQRFVLIATAVINLFLISLTYLHNRKLIAIDSFWREGRHEVADAIAYAVIFLVIAGVCWLFCHGLNRALARARQSEKELKQERDLLEIKVIERTQELRQAEEEKINQLHRVAEFGRLSSGIFHDLVNPLTALSLNLEQIKNGENNKIGDSKSYLGQALLATRRMADLIVSIKKQIKADGNQKEFSVNEEINQIIQILSYKARRANIRLDFLTTPEYYLYGDPVKFGQIVSNLITNAIEASNPNQIVKINLKKENDRLELKVNDQGRGITPTDLPKIFDSFFSTKKNEGQNLGIGLASVKNILEKDFQGKISVVSELGQGSEFSLLFPWRTVKNNKLENRIPIKNDFNKN
jgi:signal transduction histidine kinase